MPRPTTNGKYTVPKEIAALKPSDVNCFIKVIYAGTAKHYYVYASDSIPGPGSSDKSKRSSGPVIGKIEGGQFIPNAAYLEMKSGHSAGLDDAQRSKLSDSDRTEATHIAPGISGVDLENTDLQIKNYGEYAMVLAGTQAVLTKLKAYFSDTDAEMIYALSILCFILQYTPAGCIKELFDQSILSNKWPALDICRETVSDFIHLLGSHPAICETYSQSLINESSGMTAIDGHAILCCSRQNDLADYENRYQPAEETQISILQVYDVENACSLAGNAYAGKMLDPSFTRDMLTIFNYPKKTCFLPEIGFYSEVDTELYRSGGKHFIISVPESTEIRKAMTSSITFTGSFVYKRKDEDGLMYNDTILYRMSTVKELEALYQEIPERGGGWKKQGSDQCTGTMGNAKHSDYPDDLVIMYRDSDVHDSMAAEYAFQMDTDEHHTAERLAQIEAGFGLILLRCNYLPANGIERDIYLRYKKRWETETHYHFVENMLHFCGLHSSDFTAMQGLSFLTTTFGQVKSAFVRQMKSASAYVSRMSVGECLSKGAYAKMAQHKDQRWHVSLISREHAAMLEEMGVNISRDIEKLDSHTF